MYSDYDYLGTVDFLGAVNINGVPLSQVNSGGSSIYTGTEIPLNNPLVTYCNMTTPNTSLIYTVTGSINGGKARLLVNAPSLPEITGAINIKGEDFQANTDIYLEVENSNGRIEYWVKQIHINPFVDLTALPFGITVVESANPSNIFLGSPVIFKTSTGRYLVAHDYYGAGSDYAVSGTTSIYYTDAPLETNNFTKAADVVDMFWASIFEYNGNIYLLGTDKENGNITLSKSTDDGLTWSAVTTVLAAPAGAYIGWSKSPNNVIIKDGFLVAGIEAVKSSGSFGGIYEACLVFADLTDLEDAGNWSFSNKVAFNGTTFSNSEIYSNTPNTKYPPAAGQSVSKGFLEASIVELSSGNLRLFMRLEQTPASNHGVYMDVTWVPLNPSTSTISSTQNIVKLHGGNVKYQVTYDSTSDKLYSITNVNRFKDFSDQRMEGYLISSDDDGITWDILKKVVGFTPTLSWESEVLQYGAQYPSFIIDGNDILFATRLATADAVDWHNADLITLSKITGFRSLTPINYIDGGLIIDENSQRFEDVNGISIIHDQSINFNSPFLRIANNAAKPNWVSGGIQFDGASFLRVTHHESLNLTAGFSIFVVIENLQSTSGLRICSKSVGTPVANDINAPDWSFSTEGLTVGACYISSGWGDLTTTNNYILAATYDNSANAIYNFKNGVNRGAPASISGGTWATDKINKTAAFAGGNFGELYIGKRQYGSSIFFTSKIKALHIIPSYMTPTEMVDYQNALNAIYSIY